MDCRFASVREAEGRRRDGRAHTIKHKENHHEQCCRRDIVIFFAFFMGRDKDSMTSGMANGDFRPKSSYSLLFDYVKLPMYVRVYSF